MADVTRRFDGPRRAQLLILAGLLLAIVFVGIALVLNTAIFAENLATRQSSAANSDIQTFRNAAIDGVAGAIGSSNRVGANDSFVTLRDSRYRPKVTALAERLANRWSLGGDAVDLSNASSRAGTQIVDENASSTLTPRDGTPVNWTMVAAAHVRAFELTADPTTSLLESDVSDQLTGGSGNAFVVTMTPASGAAYDVAVYEDSGDVRVAVSEVGSSTVRECDAEGDNATVSLTGRPTVDGAYCDALGPVAEASGTYNVSITNGDQAVGTYRLVVDRLDGPSADEHSLDEQVDRVNYDAACNGTTYAGNASVSPYSVPAIYSGTVDLRYRSQRSTSETTVRVVPKQAGDALTTPRVVSLNVTDNSGSDASFTVNWTVDDPNDGVSEVTLELINSSTNSLVTTASNSSISSSPVTGELSVTESGGSGNTYDLRVTVTDGTNERSRTVTHVADGDTDETGGCPL